MDKRAFLAEFDLSDADLLEANITWEELLRIVAFRNTIT